ncbi:hypothetical protein [Gimesia maris]|uniref:hypothetical protein n=1 Tax=Gimesia maris TaxID=122 RepID=UPI00241D01E8|nr:hypothetical protein [Gimesia maris]|tara:strand:+ start:27203 stop:28864 length:1662 start_codon:yes stop_codon:yes gene_type:complete
MSIQDLPPEFEPLLNRLLNSPDEEISQSEFDQFQAFLSTNPEAMQYYFDYLDINLGLQSDLKARLEALEQTFKEQNAQQPQPSPHPIVVRRTAMLRYSAVASCSLLVGLLLAWSFAGFLPGNQTPDPQSSKEERTYVATLTRSTDCVWGSESPPEFSGQRLMSEDLVLEQGVAEFRFDTGVRLIIEGPTKINLVTSSRAKLDYGKLVLHGYDPAPEFSLITPLLTFQDIGTEYGAQIHRDGEVDLHVFAGAVRVAPNQKNDQFLESVIIQKGQARHLNDRKIEDIQLEPELFKREVPGTPQNLQAQRQELRVYDSFHPPEILDPEPASPWQNTGIGWVNPWRTPKSGGRANLGLSRPHESLARTEVAPSQLGLLELRGEISFFRKLKQPVRMDMNAIYYISFYMQKIKTDLKNQSYQYGNFALLPSDQQEDPPKIRIGMSINNYAILQAGPQIIERAPPLQSGETYLFVTKIVASEKASDQVFMRAFAEAEPIPDQEPPVWTCVTTPFEDSNVFDVVRLHAGKNSAYLFDEVRIGSTWSSVVDPDRPRLVLEQ